MRFRLQTEVAESFNYISLIQRLQDERNSVTQTYFVGQNDFMTSHVSLNDLTTSHEDFETSKKHHSQEEKNYFEKITDTNQIENLEDLGLKKLTER
jgi:hypothetical protein